MVVDRGDEPRLVHGPDAAGAARSRADRHAHRARRRSAFRCSCVARPADAAPRGYAGRVEAGTHRGRRRGDGAAVGPHDARARDPHVRRAAAARAAARRRHARRSPTRSTSRAATCSCARPMRRIRHARSTATLCWLDERRSTARRHYLLRHTTREVRARDRRASSTCGTCRTQEREPAPDDARDERHRAGRRSRSRSRSSPTATTTTAPPALHPDRRGDQRAPSPRGCIR